MSKKKQQKKDLLYKQKINNIDDIDDNNILVSKKEQYGTNKNSFKYFIGYNDNDIKTSTNDWIC